MTSAVSYLIAQHTPDPFRHEPRNLGVFVRHGTRVYARFLGESSGQIDGRKLRGFAFPDVYRQWIEYWRRVIATEDDSFSVLLATSSTHYQVVHGGELSDVGQDSLDDVVSYLYSLLVSEGGYFEATGGREGEPVSVRLRTSVADEFERLDILAAGDQAPAGIPHPVQRELPISGTGSIRHTPSFVQQNGKLFVMETVDFTQQQKERAKDHAGLTCYMFDDLRKARTNGTELIAIVSLRPEDRTNGAVEYGISIIEKESTRVVNWLDDEERDSFVNERRRIALGGS